MPHLRRRYLNDVIKKVMGLSPLVGVMGHRQVGKTTLLEEIAASYYTMDDTLQRKEAESDPALFIKERAGSWVAIDECQTVHDLFPELKNWVRTHKRPGQFLLSGSIRFTSREAIRESLTGRIFNLELLPFVVSELAHLPLSSVMPELLAAESFQGLQNWHFRSPKDVRKQVELMKVYFEQGGLPGICFIREAKLRTQKIDEQLNTLLDRDLRLVKNIQLPLGVLRSVVQSLASQQAQPLDYTQIKRETGVSLPTIKKVLYALEGIYLIRIIPIEGSTRGLTVFFEDQAEHGHLLQRERSLSENLTHFCFTNLRAQFEYRLGEPTQIFQYRTRGGAFIPLAFRNKLGVLGIVPMSGPDQANRTLGSVNSFLKTYSKAKVLLVHPLAESHQLIQPHVLSASVGLIS
jgi:predicted AAA+ superfamily ATPase